MDMTPDRLLCLTVVADAGGLMSHDDKALKPFCDDGSTLTKPDIFNQCHDAGWLFSRHDDRTDSSRVEITPGGYEALNRSFVFAIRQMAGPLRDGERGRGSVWHAVPHNQTYCGPALCGRAPSIQWASSAGDQVNCPRCRKKLAAMTRDPITSTQ